jgi:hypothetical protein
MAASFFEQTKSMKPRGREIEQISADPVEVFRSRCEAQATLYARGKRRKGDLLDAVDPLQEFAVKLGLNKLIGRDAVQAIMAEAFAPVRAAEKGNAP